MTDLRIPDEVRSRLKELLDQHKAKPVRVPGVGDCFFVDAPTLHPLDEPDHALLAAIQEDPTGYLLCMNMSLEYWEASEHDYLLDPGEWTGGYSAIVEAWNPILIDPNHVGSRRIHGEIRSGLLEEIRTLFAWHQAGQSPPDDFLAVGDPLPEDEADSRWGFRRREAGLLERARRHLHEGWEAKVIPFPKPSRPGRATRDEVQVPVAALGSLPLAGAMLSILGAIKAAKGDIAILEDPTGVIFLRTDRKAGLWTLIWYSPECNPPPEVVAEPPMGAPAKKLRGKAQTALGSWHIANLEKELTLEIQGLAKPLSLRLSLE
jgi:hypothetical protein